jgi:hypothetical protein
MPNDEVFTKKGLKKPRMSEKEYLETHLKRMDETKKRWTMNAMKTWTKEDYDNYTTFHLCVLSIKEDSHETD